MLNRELNRNFTHDRYLKPPNSGGAKPKSISKPPELKILGASERSKTDRATSQLCNHRRLIHAGKLPNPRQLIRNLNQLTQRHLRVLAMLRRINFIALNV
ncbi:MAG: hypothetical protein RLZZ511_3880 [Cyanobacteriota bacterium]